MTKRKKSFLLAFILPVVLLVSVVVIYQARYAYIQSQGEKVLDEYFVTCNLPKEETIDITKSSEKIMGNMFAWNAEVNKNVTTKKDYDNWKKIVKEKGQLFNGQKLPNNAYLEDIKNCEISYSASVSSEKLNQKNVYYQFVWGGNSVTDEKFVLEHFSYIPPKNLLDKWLKDHLG